jgi:hypothetical protein
MGAPGAARSQRFGKWMMRSTRIVVCLGVIVAPAGAATAAETATVQSLLSQEFAIVGAITSPVGPGLFLQKKDQLFVCFVSETPQSPAVTTRYCKPVQ